MDLGLADRGLDEHPCHFGNRDDPLAAEDAIANADLAPGLGVEELLVDDQARAARVDPAAFDEFPLHCQPCLRFQETRPRMLERGGLLVSQERGPFLFARVRHLHDHIGPPTGQTEFLLGFFQEVTRLGQFVARHEPLLQ